MSFYIQNSFRDMTIRLSSSEKNLYPDKNSWTSGSVDGGRRLSIEASGEDTGEVHTIVSFRSISFYLQIIYLF